MPTYTVTVSGQEDKALNHARVMENKTRQANGQPPLTPAEFVDAVVARAVAAMLDVYQSFRGKDVGLKYLNAPPTVQAQVDTLLP